MYRLCGSFDCGPQLPQQPAQNDLWSSTLMKPVQRAQARRVLLVPVALLAVLCCWLAPAAASASSDSSDDMVVFGGHQVVQAGQEVNGDLVVLGGSADVYGTVHGDAVAIGGRIYVAPQGVIDGSFVSLGGFIDNESTTTPHTRTHVPHHTIVPPVMPMPTEAPVTPDESSSGGGWTTFVLVDAVLVLLGFLLFPVKTREALGHLLENPLIAGVVGFFSPIILALVLTALAITVIGIPLIPLVLILTAIGYLIGKAALAEFLGTRLFEIARVQVPAPLASLLVGLVVLTVVSLFGWEGIVIYFCIAAIAFGTAFYGFGRAVNNRRRFSTLPPSPPPSPAPHEFAPPAGPAPTGPPAVQ